MKKQVYETDNNGYLIDIHLIDESEETNHIKTNPPDGLYRAKWTGTEWIEDMTQKEIDILNNQPKEPTEQERLEALEQAMLEIALGGM